MSSFLIHLHVAAGGSPRTRSLALGVLALAIMLPAYGQQTNPPAQQAAPAPSAVLPAQQSPTREITEEEIRQMLVGKPLILRGGYLDDTLKFNEHGALIDPSPRGSFTLSGVQINRVHLTRHKLELEGDRYGLRYQGSDPNNTPSGEVERVKITPKKKVLKITVDRVVEAKEKGQPKGSGKRKKSDASGDELPGPAASASPPRSRDTLRVALDRVFAASIDDRFIATLPPYWKLYYQALAAGKEFKPSDPAVLRQTEVDKKARLVSVFEPKSNEFAQAHDVAGMAMLHTVIGPDGKPGEIALGQPIGFGLDENAVDAVRNATFEAAIKDGKPVAVALDLVVEFHIYSKLTSQASAAGDAGNSAAPSLPGPYSAKQP